MCEGACVCVCVLKEDGLAVTAAPARAPLAAPRLSPALPALPPRPHFFEGSVLSQNSTPELLSASLSSRLCS